MVCVELRDWASRSVAALPIPTTDRNEASNASFPSGKHLCVERRQVLSSLGIVLFRPVGVVVAALWAGRLAALNDRSRAIR